MVVAASLIALSCAALSCARPESGAPELPHTEAPPPGWALTWSDDFEGAAGSRADSSHWSHDVGDGCAAGICGWGNEEKEYYTTELPNASLTGGGALAIVARPAPPGLACYYGPCRYTSAKLRTRDRVQVKHGRVEARLRLPRGQGLWPAFWMLGSSFGATPWPACGELDIMENHGSRPASISSAIHGPGYSGSTTPFVHDRSLPSGDYADDFHTFGVQWDSARVEFMVDGAVHYVVSKGEVERHGAWVFDQPFYVILNLAVGGSFDGDPKSDAILPATMLVDWVRVYERTGAR